MFGCSVTLFSDSDGAIQSVVEGHNILYLKESPNKALFHREVGSAGIRPLDSHDILRNFAHEKTCLLLPLITKKKTIPLVNVYSSMNHIAVTSSPLNSSTPPKTNIALKNWNTILFLWKPFEASFNGLGVSLCCTSPSTKSHVCHFLESSLCC